MAAPVDEACDLDREQFAMSFVRASRPVVLRCEPAALALANIFSLDRIAAEQGAVIVPVQRSRTRMFAGKDGDGDQGAIEMSLRDLVEHVRGTCPHAGWLYLQELSISAFLPWLAGAIALPDILAGDVKTDVRLWIGPASCATVLHHDRSDNLLMQLDGRKHITLFDPYQSRYLYAYPADSPHHHMSRISFANGVDLEQFPLFARTASLCTALGPGDALFIPAYWWHLIESESATVSINAWW